MTDILMSRERFSDSCWRIRAKGGEFRMSFWFYGSVAEAEKAVAMCRAGVEDMQRKIAAAYTSDEPAESSRP